MRGRKPEPRAIKELKTRRKATATAREVNTERARSPAREARPAAKATFPPLATPASPPASASPSANQISVKRAYKRTVKALAEIGLIKDVDKQAAMLMSMHYVLALRAFAEMESLTRDDENGVTRKHPLLQVIRDASEMFKGYAAEFGMTPTSRERLALNPQDDRDPFERFLEGVDL